MELQITIEQFIDEITEGRLAELRKTDEEYQCTHRELLRLSEEIQKEMGTLSEEQKKIFTDYSNVRSQEERANGIHLYWSGLLDAVALLKTVGVL